MKTEYIALEAHLADAQARGLVAKFKISVLDDGLYLTVERGARSPKNLRKILADKLGSQVTSSRIAIMDFVG